MFRKSFFGGQYAIFLYTPITGLGAENVPVLLKAGPRPVLLSLQNRSALLLNVGECLMIKTRALGRYRN